MSKQNQAGEQPPKTWTLVVGPGYTVQVRDDLASIDDSAFRAALLRKLTQKFTAVTAQAGSLTEPDDAVIGNLLSHVPYESTGEKGAMKMSFFDNLYSQTAQRLAARRRRAQAYRASLPVAPAPPGQEYVDPYLFETGHFESREEYEELSKNAKIKARARS